MKDDDQERIKAYMAAKMTHIKMYNECMNLADGLDVEKFAELVRADEREACAKVCDEQSDRDGFEGGYANECAELIRARGEKPWVKTYCGGKPNYCTPVDAVNMTQERVDETAKGEHEPVAWLDSDGFPWSKEGVECRTTQDTYKPLYTAPPKKEWVGLTHEEIQAERHKLDPTAGWTYEHFARAIEAKLKEKNGG